MLLAIAIALYYLRFIKNDLTLYPLGARCLLANQPLLECAPTFTYPPFFAFVMIPFAGLPLWAAHLEWYALSIAGLLLSFRLCETLALRTFGVELEERRRYWLRLLAFVLSLKFMLAVLENQAYDFLILLFLLIGIHGLVERKALQAGAGFALAAALKLTPLLFFPYLFFRKRWRVGVIALACYLVASLLPDLVFAVSGREDGYFITWVQQIIHPAVSSDAGGTSAANPRFWEGTNPLNQSLRALVYRIAVALDLAAQFPTMLLATYAPFAACLFLIVRRASGLERPWALDVAVLMIGMLMLSPMSSKSHFVVLLLPSMLIAAYLLIQERPNPAMLPLLIVSFALNSLTSKDILGKQLSTTLQYMGAITIGTLLVLVMIGMIVWRIVKERERNTGGVSPPPQ